MLFMLFSFHLGSDTRLPQLPSPATKKKKHFSFTSKKSDQKDADKQRRKNKSSNEAGVDISKRPPCPLPASTQPTHRPAGYEYDVVRNVTVNRVTDLITTLRSNDEVERCECGLTMAEAELPRDWSMHISHDPHTQGRLFFMGPGNVTNWNLPLDVSLELSPDDQDRIRRVKDYCNELQFKYHQQMQQMQQRQTGPAVQTVPQSDSLFASGSSSSSRNRTTSNASSSNSDPNALSMQYFQQPSPQTPNTQHLDDDVPAELRIPPADRDRSHSEVSYTMPVARSDDDTPLSDLSGPSFTAPPVPTDSHRQAVQHNLQTGSTTGAQS